MFEPPIELAWKRSSPNIFHSHSLPTVVERRLTTTSFARSSSVVGHRISAQDCMEEEIHSNLVHVFDFFFFTALDLWF
ncbi:hypothetical protein TIFTF001_015240 [Ficus carica]|uniref:Uncharacterized protein n=1 Tax=Ficus carica TaxID=3494 RepID=A0AA88A5G6_FICCA|nr:hypothetical protein TIFTF001_015240 [Ficus carica]